MGIEGRHLIDLGHGDSQLFAKRLHMASGQTPLVVLNEMQIFNQHVTLARPITKQLGDGFRFFAFKQPAFRKDRRLAPARTGMDAAVFAAVRHIVHVPRLFH